MPDISRRTLVTTGASLLTTSASLMMLRVADAAMHEASAMGGGHHTTEEMARCIRLCQDCHVLCVQMIGHCLELGGRHAAPDHIRLLMDCAQICTTTADYMARESSLHDRMCGLCSEMCRLCAESCEHITGDDQMVKQCAEMCRRCAASCTQMTSKDAA